MKIALSDHQAAVLGFVIVLGKAGSKEVAERFKAPLAAAGNVLVKLMRKGYLDRVNRGDPTGGALYSYRLAAALSSERSSCRETGIAKDHPSADSGVRENEGESIDE